MYNDPNQNPYGQQSRYQQGYNYNCPPSPQWLANDPFAEGPSGKSRGVAGLLAIFLGGLGIQYFYLGKTTPGIVCLLVSILSCGILGTVIALLTLVQGILMLCMNNREFEEKYVGPRSASFPIF